jgi:hypothetical protein
MKIGTVSKVCHTSSTVILSAVAHDFTYFSHLTAACQTEGPELEWVVDVADAEGGWFIGTAYGFAGTRPPDSAFYVELDHL